VDRRRRRDDPFELRCSSPYSSPYCCI
jgi:hypothetical protein